MPDEKVILTSLARQPEVDLGLRHQNTPCINFGNFGHNQFLYVFDWWCLILSTICRLAH